MPNDHREVHIDKDSHKIDIMFIPSSDEHATANGNIVNGEVDDDDDDDEICNENDVQLRHANENDEITKTALWQSGTLGTWPAIDLNQLIQQTITRCTNTASGKQKIKTTTVRKQTDSVDSCNSVVIYPRFETLLSGSKEIIL